MAVLLTSSKLIGLDNIFLYFSPQTNISWISIHGICSNVGSSIGKLQMAISTPPDFNNRTKL